MEVLGRLQMHLSRAEPRASSETQRQEQLRETAE
jgi:hypothetical protein